MRATAGYSIGGGVDNNFTARTRYGTEFSYSRNEIGGWGSWFGGDLETRINDRLHLGVDAGYSRTTTSRQYVAAIDGGPSATYGQRYVFSWLDQSEISTQIRVNYYFTPDLSLEVYGEPFASSGRYYDFGELRRAYDNDLKTYGAEGTTITGDGGEYEVTDGGDSFTFSAKDFGYLSFRSNVVLRWEFRRGSTLFLVWQQDRSGDDDPGRHVHPKSLFDSITTSGENFLAVKVSYWIPVT
jgi:hypothetical protein